mgnify:FL=1|jgi:hypothetical protein|tara:strand:- start:53 stop:520 length:468 start_codon:yes stop_codon:yes gene_type:complete
MSTNYQLSQCKGVSLECTKFDREQELYTPCQPHGTFFVQLKHYNFMDHYYKGGANSISPSASGIPAKNIVYMVDHPGNYIKRFNNLVSMNKLKINIRNIVGKPLWGCNNERAENAIWKQNTSSDGKETNLLRWELMFKVKYYVNVQENKFLLHNG